MSHPCDGHPCDHCYQCDVEGVCCQTVAARQAAQASAARPDPLRAAIARDARVVPSLRELVRQEAEAGSLPAVRMGLLAAAGSDRLPSTPRKDAAYVVPSRSNQ